MAQSAPRAFNRETYHERNMVFYGTDDGAQDGSFREMKQIIRHYDSLPAHRRQDVHMVSVVGGLYSLNLVPLWQPRRITIFDINPVATAYFRLIHRALLASSDARDFLKRLSDGDYDANGEDEEWVRENIRLKQAGRLPRSRGSSKRSYEQSWTLALSDFAKTKRVLQEAQVEVRTEPMESESFRAWARPQQNLWFYCSNIAQFHFFDIDFDDPRNVLLLAIIFPEQVDFLDLAPMAGGPVRAQVRIPMRAVRLGPDGTPQHAQKQAFRMVDGPGKLGTYSQAVRCGDLLFLTAQPGLNWRKGRMEDGLEAQTRQMFDNIENILAGAGRTPADIVKVTLMMTDIKDFKAIDDLYKAWLPHPSIACYPARTALQAAALPGGARVAMDVVASA